MSEIFLIRHAQASFSADNYDELSELGVEQSRILGAYLAEHDIRFDGALSGAMQRHRQTLDEILNVVQTGGPVKTHEGLNEYDFRAMLEIYCDLHAEDELVLARKTSPQDRKAFFRLLRRVLTSWSVNELDGAPESWNAFQQRVADARAELQDMSSGARRIIVMTSGGAISMFVGSVLGLSPGRVFDLNMQLLNTSITRFYCEHQNIKLATFNTVPHFASPKRSWLLTYS